MTRKEDYDEVAIADSISYGKQADGPVIETDTPGKFDFLAGNDRDIYEQTTATISNGATSSVTEDVKLQIREYDDDGTIGSQVFFRSQSVTIAAGGSTTVTYAPSSRFRLPQDKYQVKLIFETGTSFTPTETQVTTTGGQYGFTEADGDLVIADHDGTERGRWGALDEGFTSSSSKAKQATITEPVVRAYPITTDETANTPVTGPSYRDYPISDYNDILDATRQALADGGSKSAVELPPGEFTASTSVSFEPGQSVQGAGRLATTINYSGSSPAFVFDGVHSCSVRNMQFLDDGATAAAIQFNDSTFNPFQIEFSNLRFAGWDVSPVNSNNSRCHVLRFSGCFFQGGSATHASMAPVSGISNVWINCNFRDIPEGKIGLDTEGTGVSVIGCEFLSKNIGARCGLRIRQCAGFTVMGCNFENLNNDDSTNADALGNAIELSDADQKFWRSGRILSNHYGGVHGNAGVETFVYADGIALNDRVIVTVANNDVIGSARQEIDMNDQGQGWLYQIPFNDSSIINDRNTRVLGRTLQGESIVRTGERGAKYTLGDNVVRDINSDSTAVDDGVYLVDASGGAITVTMPAATSGLEVVVKKVDSSSNAVTIATPNTETIDGASSASLGTQYESSTITSNGTNYFVLD